MHPPKVFVIAELGVNHDGDPEVGLRLADAAADAGADAIKVQVFRPDRLLSNQARLAFYQEGKAADARELLAKLAMGVDTLGPLAEHARQRELLFIATPFSPHDMSDLESLGVDAVKIASPDAVNTPLLEAAAVLNKPMLISTGTCELDELVSAAQVIRGHHAGGAILHCVSCYPTPREHASLGAIGVMREALGLPIGYSDHTAAIDTGALAVAAGAVVIEKHLTHDKSAPGPDHAASLTGSEFERYVGKIRDAERVLGPSVKRVLPIEADVREVSRQSVCIAHDLPAGHTLSRADLTVMRPGTGIPAARIESLIGRRLLSASKRGDLLLEDQIDGR